MISVLGDRVLVAIPPEPEEVTTESGLTLVRDPDRGKIPTRGIVVRLGHKTNTCDLHDVRNEVHTWFVEARGSLDLTLDEAAAHVDRLLMKMQPAPFDVEIGDCVLFSAGAGDEVEDEGIRFVILHESDLLATVAPIGHARVWLDEIVRVIEQTLQKEDA